jgi:Ca2+-binding RTX toxin-like protein
MPSQAGDDNNNLINVTLGNYAFGLGGNDRIIGTDGDEVMYGGHGDDIIYGKNYASFSGTGTFLDPFRDVIIEAGSGPDYIFGDQGSDILYGGDGNDQIYGGRHDDSGIVLSYAGLWYKAGLFGGDGEDFLSGDQGHDDLFGGNGNDVLDGGEDNDNLDPGAGVNRVDGGSGTDTMIVGADLANVTFDLSWDHDIILQRNTGGLIEAQTVDGVEFFNFNGVIKTLFDITPLDIEGNDGNNTLNGTANGEIIRGMGGNDKLNGNGGADRLYGGKGKDNLKGGDGNDTLFGSSGKDKLTGNAGADTFVFNHFGNKSADRVMDYSVADDTVWLNNAKFSSLANGALNAANFVSGAAAVDADDFVIYDATTGKLFYDADGNGAGAQKLVASFDGLPALTASEFFII